jgi:hypothetical protein
MYTYAGLQFRTAFPCWLEHEDELHIQNANAAHRLDNIFIKARLTIF